MEDQTLIKEFFHHMHWADNELWKVLENSPKAESNDKIMELLYHIHLVQFLYLKIWKNEKLEYPKKNEFDSIKQIIKWGKENYIKFNKFISDVPESRYIEIAKIPWTNGLEKKIGKKPEEVSVKETMLQVVFHSSYHRAQINTKLRKLDLTPPLFDYIYWLWMGKPTIK
ncbi:MAG: hypothetical protein CO128_05845 [Ignavibacteriales bacterium CG_4_9_14_3_um_filter_30_11]|nr:MAG: hypothetical protein CO128_05845 [Ignavibacteriales bacterium CG_4_9_14_3_um_filter_30_11]